MLNMKIVYFYIVGDLLHIGHLMALENAKAIAGEDGKLIVGVLTDSATQEKKPTPTISFNDRIRLIKSLKCVDVAVAQDTYSPLNNVMKIKPDVLMESDSHSEEDLKELKKVTDKINCKILMLPYYPGQSSTKIKREVKDGEK